MDKKNWFGIALVTLGGAGAGVLHYLGMKKKEARQEVKLGLVDKGFSPEEADKLIADSLAQTGVLPNLLLVSSPASKTITDALM